MSNIFPATSTLANKVFSREVVAKPERSQCVRQAGKAFVFALIGWAAFPILNVNDYANRQPPWHLNRNIVKLVLDCAALFLVSSLLCLCASVKYAAAAIFSPKIAYKTPLNFITA